MVKSPRMKNKKLFIAGVLFTGLVGLSQGFAHTDGYMVTDYVDQEMILDSSKPLIEPSVAAAMIESYILKINPDRDAKSPNDISTKELAKRIAGVSYCFELDPFVYTALIHKESINYYQRAKSPTGASGLTQFTTIAVKEVNDQLGIRGNKHAQTEAINYFTQMLAGDCLKNNGGFTSMGKNYVHLWELDPAASLVKSSSSQAAKMVSMMMDLPEYALVYGAILLKVNFSLVKSGYKTGCYETKPVALKDKIKEAVMYYNGDGCNTMTKYQSDILGRFYTGITGTKSK